VGWVSVLGLVLASAAWGRPVAAQVTQTDAVNTPLPQAVSAAEADLVNNSWGWNANTTVNRDPQGVALNPPIRYGDYYSPPAFPQFVTGDAITLRGLFKWRKEVIDPVQDAKIAPGYFSGKCGFTGELLLMGSNCQVQFGWYNVTDPASKTPPAANEIHPFITGKPQDQLNCVEGDGVTRKTDGFCPLAWDNRHPYDLSVKRWTPKSFASGDLTKGTQYKGGYVGFAMIGDPSRCTQSKFSMFEHNQRNANGVPWVTTLIYQSKLDPSAFYFAFEDLPMSTADWKKTPTGASGSGADGDFNDLVFFVSGVDCAGGNQACDTGQYGACAIGRTDCAADGEAAVCRPVLQKREEICDNVDNDCDGLVDDGAGLCPDSNAPICFRGACVASCKGGGFSCPVGSTCDESGRCVDPTCAALSCMPGTVCHAGACVGEPCSGVVCPYGKQCELGQCVDPCAGVTCSNGRVCEKGVCVPNCTCNGCAAGLTCGADGRCADVACVGNACPSGTTCLLGACVDPCAGVACPNQDICSNGFCSSLPSSGGSAGQGGALSFGGNAAAGSGTGGLAQAGAAAATEDGGMANAAGAADVAGDSSVAGSSTAAGNSNATGGAGASSAGASASGRGGTPATAAEKSSSCSCALPGQGGAQPVLPLLGVVFSAALMRRRRRRADAERKPRGLAAVAVSGLRAAQGRVMSITKISGGQ
jgi:hypothetical protein